MFDKSAFQQALDHFLSCTTRIHDEKTNIWQTGFSFNGRGLPKAFVQAAQDLSSKTGHSSIARASALNQIQDALKELRYQHKQASGGLPAAIWQHAEISMDFNGSRFSYIRPGQGNTRKDQHFGTSDTLADRLENHAALDLSGPLRLFEMAPQNNSLSPRKIEAPTPELAVARMKILLGSNLDGWRNPVLREVLDASLYF